MASEQQWVKARPDPTVAPQDLGFTWSSSQRRNGEQEVIKSKLKFLHWIGFGEITLPKEKPTCETAGPSNELQRHPTARERCGPGLGIYRHLSPWAGGETSGRAGSRFGLLLGRRQQAAASIHTAAYRGFSGTGEESHLQISSGCFHSLKIGSAAPKQSEWKTQEGWLDGKRVLPLIG